jgi:hypothetical protein
VPLEILVLREKLKVKSLVNMEIAGIYGHPFPPTIRYNRVAHWKVYGKTQGTHGKKDGHVFKNLGNVLEIDGTIV